MKKFIAATLLGVVLFSCSNQVNDQNESDDGQKVNKPVVADIIELSDTDYPDNPDISIRHSLDGTFAHSLISIDKNEKGFTLVLLPENNESDTLILHDLDLLEWMPTIPSYIKSDDYLSLVCVINQEWNRQQVKLFEDKYSFQGVGLESQVTKRVDLARNCLNSYLWEVISYADSNGKLQPVYHGWFDFPKSLYTELFEERNGVPFEKYSEFLVDWKDIESEELNLSYLREVKVTTEVLFRAKNDLLYPLIGERGKKHKNIIYPQNVSVIQDFLNDSTQFGTFSPPGFYNTKDPRQTRLSLLSKLIQVDNSVVVSKNTKADTCIELNLTFDNGEGVKTSLVIGGISIDDIPVLEEMNAHKGFQMPMGVANHSFYETYDQNQYNKVETNPYYGFLLDEEGHWLDSHLIGIDGPLLHFDAEGKLHFWILSFERHAFVGHYVLEI